MTYIGKLIDENRLLWNEVVDHELLSDMLEDSLPIDRFRDYMLQLQWLTVEGIRYILCRLMVDTPGDSGMTAAIMNHIHSVQPGGDDFEAIQEMLKATGLHEPMHASPLPPTEALTDFLFLVGHKGSVHDKLLALSTLVEISNSRFKQARDRNKHPMNSIYSTWFAHHSAAIEKPKLEWLHSSLDKSTCVDWSYDNHIFRRIVQLVILMNDAVRYRGRYEWSAESKYYHRRF